MANADVVDGDTEAMVAQLGHDGCGAREIVELLGIDPSQRGPG